MSEQWHSIELTSLCDPETPADGQLLLPLARPHSDAARLVVRCGSRTKLVTGGAHSDQHDAGCARPELIATLDAGDASVAYRPATTADRFRHDGTLRLDLALAVILLAAAIAAGAVTVVKALNDSKLTAPLWLILGGAVLAALAAMLKFVRDLREA